jgi:hypothetical protein
MVNKKQLLSVGAFVVLPILVGAANSSRAPGSIFQLDTLRAIAVPVSKEIAAEIRDKVELDMARLKRSVRYRGLVPILVLNDGKEVALAPVSVITKASPALRSKSEFESESIRQLAPFFKLKGASPVESTEGAVSAAVTSIAAADVADHRSCQTPIRDQGSRGSCTAFASTAAIEGFESCHKQRTVELSEEHAYHIFMKENGCTCPGDCGATTYKTADYLTKNRICLASQLPYNSSVVGLPADDRKHVPAACSSASQYGFKPEGTQPILGIAYLPNAQPPTDQNANTWNRSSTAVMT